MIGAKIWRRSHTAGVPCRHIVLLATIYVSLKSIGVYPKTRQRLYGFRIQVVQDDGIALRAVGSLPRLVPDIPLALVPFVVSSLENYSMIGKSLPVRANIVPQSRVAYECIKIFQLWLAR